MSPTPAIAVDDNAAGQRYEVRLDGELAGFAQYRAGPGLITFLHTEIDDRFEGQGLASRLISFALEDARERGLAVLPLCPFVSAYVQQHPEYADLVPADRRAEFDL